MGPVIGGTESPKLDFLRWDSATSQGIFQLLGRPRPGQNSEQWASALPSAEDAEVVTCLAATLIDTCGWKVWHTACWQKAQHGRMRHCPLGGAVSWSWRNSYPGAGRMSSWILGQLQKLLVQCRGDAIMQNNLKKMGS